MIRFISSWRSFGLYYEFHNLPAYQSNQQRRGIGSMVEYQVAKIIISNKLLNNNYVSVKNNMLLPVE